MSSIERHFCVVRIDPSTETFVSVESVKHTYDEAMEEAIRISMEEPEYNHIVWCAI